LSTDANKQLSSGSAEQFRGYELSTDNGILIGTIIVTTGSPPPGLSASNHEYIFYAPGGEQAWKDHGGNLLFKNAAQDSSSFLNNLTLNSPDVSIPNSGFVPTEPGDWFLDNSSVSSFENTNGAGETRAVVVEFAGNQISRLGWIRRSSSLTNVLFSNQLGTVNAEIVLTRRVENVGENWNLKSMMVE